MSAGRVRSLLAATAVAAVLSHGLSGHGVPHMSSDDGVAGAAAGLCLLLTTALAFVGIPTPRTHPARVVRERARLAGSSPPETPRDARARASPIALQRFRN